MLKPRCRCRLTASLDSPPTLLSSPCHQLAGSRGQLLTGSTLPTIRLFTPPKTPAHLEGPAPPITSGTRPSQQSSGLLQATGHQSDTTPHTNDTGFWQLDGPCLMLSSFAALLLPTVLHSTLASPQAQVDPAVCQPVLLPATAAASPLWAPLFPIRPCTP